MPSRRTVLLTLALLLAIGTGFVAFSDVRYEDQNCGSAMLPKSTTVTFDTGDPAQDELLQQTTEVECGHLLSRQRYLIFVGSLLVVVCWARARRLKREESPFGTEPVV